MDTPDTRLSKPQALPRIWTAHAVRMLVWLIALSLFELARR
jgi:hypothetical protein